MFCYLLFDGYIDLSDVVSNDILIRDSLNIYAGFKSFSERNISFPSDP